MCSVDEEELEEIKFMQSETPVLLTENIDCKKCCNQKAEIILRKKDPYCRDCFLASVTHKFRGSLGRAKLIRPGDRVLLAVSGDAASSALVNLVREGLHEDTHKKLRFQPVALYIDEGIITQINFAERKLRSAQIKRKLESEDIHCYISSIGDALLDTEVKLHEDLTIDEDANAAVVQLFAAVTSLTAKQDLLKKLRQQLLVSFAKVLNCSFVFVADTATKLAAGLLANLALGGGAQLSSEASFCDARNYGVKFLRPMRDFTSDDLNMYVAFKEIYHIPHKSLTNCDNPYASIQSLTKKFVYDLQENFPATIPTVLRTGDKTESKGSDSTNPIEEDTCSLCQSPLDTQDNPCSALRATEFSREISNQSSNCSSSVAGAAEQSPGTGKCGGCSCGPPGARPSRAQMDVFLCYSCRLLLRDVRDLATLPTSLLNSIKMKTSLRDIRNDIKDYLL